MSTDIRKLLNVSVKWLVEVRDSILCQDRGQNIYYWYSINFNPDSSALRVNFKKSLRFTDVTNTEFTESDLKRAVTKE